jgi:hypothetical protein
MTMTEHKLPTDLSKLDLTKPMTAQEVFDAVCVRLRDGTGRALDCNGCAYQTSDGMKCAIGIFIPDSKYDKVIEGYNISGYMVEFYVPALVGLDIDFLRTLQSCHDGVSYWNGPNYFAEWKLKEVAKEYGLIYVPPIKNHAFELTNGKK